MQPIAEASGSEKHVAIRSRAVARVRPQCRRHGAALMVCIFVVSVTTAMVVGVLQSGMLNQTVLRNTIDYERAFYVASAGVNHGLAELEENMMWRTGLSDVEFPAGSGSTYSVVVTDGTGDQVIVTATGTANGFTRRLQVTVEPGV